MNAWETEDECATAAQGSLPSPMGTPSRTPSRGSRRSSRPKSNSPSSSSPPPLPNDERLRRGSNDVNVDESISILDPRRFTPTLHANLVSEILALRRDQEEKIRTIELLEIDLHDSRGVHEELDSNLAEISKENRSLKRQLTLLEGSSSAALREAAKERDGAVESNSEYKRRIEAAQKKLRRQEEDSDRTHELWSRDKDNWEEEKRKLERRAHVAETRLKAVLDEVSTYQSRNSEHLNESESEDASRDSINCHVLGSDTESIRAMSLTNSCIRFSMLSVLNSYGESKLTSLSLAEELELGEDEDQADHDGRESVTSVRQRRSQSRESIVSRNQRRRTQSIDSLIRPSSTTGGRSLAQHVVPDKFEDGILEDDETVPLKLDYTDTGIQFSPPPSPHLSVVNHASVIDIWPVSGITTAKFERLQESVIPRECEIEANQRRKRVHATPPLIIDHPISLSMVSSASQTLEDPMSPPWTPKSPTDAPPHTPDEDQVQATISISTQTDLSGVQTPLPSARRALPPSPVAIPSIQLHPPNSVPATPHEPLLPQFFRDAGCQASVHPSMSSRSVSVQTEEIRVAQRLNLLPPHLQPSAISSAPPSPEPFEEQQNKRFSPVPGNLPPRNPRRMRSHKSLEQEIPSSPPQSLSRTRDAYPGNNDDGPLTSKERTSIRRPHRISSLFAGFENVSSDDGEDFADGDVSDNGYRTALSAPKPHIGGYRSSKGASPPPVSVSELMGSNETPESSQDVEGRNSRHVRNRFNGELSREVQELPSRSTRGTARQLDKPLRMAANNRPVPPVTECEVQFGHGDPVLAVEVFIGQTAFEESDQLPQSPEGALVVIDVTGVVRRHQCRHLLKLPEVLSHAQCQAAKRRCHDTCERRVVGDTVPIRGNSPLRTHTSFGTVKNASSVVDAIAQTMVGEWMFKYVRRRKSFGVAESNGIEGDNANGIRHKRWVWLAPYERAVMWSSKQPTSGSALMGKTGRKLTIQSVLDVKDDNAPPRGSPPLFNRSILILTPTRALKFTATSPERHYTWLTALSFLAHSSQALPEISQAPLPLPGASIPDFESPSQVRRLCRGGIRDSIRVAKGKTVLAQHGPTRVPSSHKENSIRETESVYSRSDPIVPEVSAKPPVVPRFLDRRQGGLGSIPSAPTHGRKRSNTGGRVPPPPSFRGFSGPASSGHVQTSNTAGMSGHTSGPSDIYQPQFHPSSCTAGQLNTSVSGHSSIRSSDAGNRPGAVVNNFFDAVSTMRMEAFISPVALNRFDDFPDEQDEMDLAGNYRRYSKERHQRSMNRESFYFSRGRRSEEFFGGNKTAGEEEHRHFDSGCCHDPFRGF
ncbi:hypothetical protein B2J93_5200 [Marssonina coronariae]|uniref:Pleckstrin homology domain-containing protein n=1 Tax=Diplocarpon coronariae TaxID=2795749 RepID=A0A218Z3D6_9HELO|nr:hypothetical protein B2J93_5200 [Marssonina coronariae]